jgi:hypothetical protein
MQTSKLMKVLDCKKCRIRVVRRRHHITYTCAVADWCNPGEKLFIWIGSHNIQTIF